MMTGCMQISTGTASMVCMRALIQNTTEVSLMKGIKVARFSKESASSDYISDLGTKCTWKSFRVKH